ncbi:MAG TPA: hypothetical protein VFA56_04300 [Gaiellaceae bacterium]|nr:hypothetical protein [Gaiellaceae bacterium]
MLLERFPVSVGVVAGLVIALTGMFVLSMPVYHSPIDKTLLAKPKAPRYTLAEVRAVFARRRVPLDRTPGLYVVLAGSRGAAAREDYAYERRVANVVVHYGGGDADVLNRVRAAVAALGA